MNSRVGKLRLDSSFVKMKSEKPKYKDKRFGELFIERMQQLRNERGLTQEALIENIHLDISRYETGDSVPSVQSILKICKFYNITLDEFFAPLNYPPKE